jgi:hypothetical protein
VSAVLTTVAAAATMATGAVFALLIAAKFGIPLEMVGERR